MYLHITTRWLSNCQLIFNDNDDCFCFYSLKTTNFQIPVTLHHKMEGTVQQHFILKGNRAPFRSETASERVRVRQHCCPRWRKPMGSIEIKGDCHFFKTVFINVYLSVCVCVCDSTEHGRVARSPARVIWGDGNVSLAAYQPWNQSCVTHSYLK